MGIGQYGIGVTVIFVLYSIVALRFPFVKSSSPVPCFTSFPHTVCYVDPRFLMLCIYLCSGETAHFLHHLTIHVDLHKYCKTITGQFSGFISEKKMSHMFLETCVRVQILGGKQVKKSPAFITKRSKM